MAYGPTQPTIHPIGTEKLMPSLGAPELLIVLVIVLLLFGGAKLPKLARSMGDAKREFENSQRPAPSTDPSADPALQKP